MLADLLEREVKKETGVNGAAPLVAGGKELRISDNGLELIPKDSRGRFAVDMGVVGINDLTGVDMGDGAAAPKAAHLIAQVDDSGHVQIHLEEETEGSAAMCNGQSLLDQLEACEVSSSTDSGSNCKQGIKRPAPEPIEETKSSVKRTMTTNHHTGDHSIKAETTNSPDPGPDKIVVNGGVANGESSPIVSVIATGSSPQVQPTPPPPVILGPNAPRTFLILQPQTQQQANLAGGFHPQGQRLLLAIQRPGGMVQHVAMPANVVAISSNQLQTNGGIVTLTTSGGIATAVVSTQAPPTAILGGQSPITTVASSGAVVTTASMDGMVTFSGGAVAFPARPTESTSRTSSPGESHVTITPVSASSNSATSVTTTTSSPAVVVSTAAAAAKKRTTSVDSPKPRGRPAKTKSIDTPPTPPAVAVASPTPSPLPPYNPTHQYLCEWKDCMKAFKTPHEVYIHACHVHCPAHIDELGCLWERCDGLKRRRFSMMTHLMDRHCNDEVRSCSAFFPQ